MSVEFEPVGLRPRRRRIDPVAVGLVVVTAALIVAVVKPWGDLAPAISNGPSPADPSPTPASPAIAAQGPLLPPTWSDLVTVVSRRSAWGIRTIVIDSANEASSGASTRYAERWVAADFIRGEDASAVVDGRDGAIVALGITFPPTETPLAVRIWLNHAGGELEWIDARPVDEVPVRGAYLFLRRSVVGAAVRAWGPGRYRVDVLVGDGIRRVGVEIPDRSGLPRDPEPWARVVSRVAGPDVSRLGGLPVGLFAQVDPGVVPLASMPGPALDESGAWLDLDRSANDLEPRSFVARIHQPRAVRLGVVLPPSSTIRSSVVHRLAPFDDTTQIVGETATSSGDTLSFVAFAPAGGATWRPGVYAVTVVWEDSDGAHDRTWHVELRPGPVQVEPILLSATRAWARHAGSAGILMATAETWSLHEAFDGSSAIGCGRAGIRGRPTVIGFVGPQDADLTPVSSTMLFPFADVGPLPVLTAAGAVPGLALVAPLLTAEFGGPAAYGFRAGSGADAPGYTICIGLVPPAG